MGLKSSLCLIFLYLVLLSIPSCTAGNEMTYFWNILQCFQLCSAYTKTKQIHNRGLWDWMEYASKRRTGYSMSQSSNSWQKARQIENRLWNKLVYNSMTIPFKKCSVFDQCLHWSLCLCPSAENKATLCYHRQDFFNDRI